MPCPYNRRHPCSVCLVLRYNQRVGTRSAMSRPPPRDLASSSQQSYEAAIGCPISCDLFSASITAAAAIHSRSGFEAIDFACSANSNNASARGVTSQIVAFDPFR